MECTAESIRSTGEYKTKVNFISDFRHGKQAEKSHCNHFYPGVHSSMIVTDYSIRFLEQAPEDKTFFSMLHFGLRTILEGCRTAFAGYMTSKRCRFQPISSRNTRLNSGDMTCGMKRLAPYPRTEKDTRKQDSRLLCNDNPP